MAKDFISGLASIAIERFKFIQKYDKSKQDIIQFRSSSSLDKIKLDSDDNDSSSESETDSNSFSNSNSSADIKNKSQYFGIDDDKTNKMENMVFKSEKIYYETRFSRIISGIVGSLAFQNFRERSCEHILMCNDTKFIENILDDVYRIVNNSPVSWINGDPEFLQGFSSIENGQTYLIISKNNIVPYTYYELPSLDSLENSLFGIANIEELHSSVESILYSEF
jgi:hypothetical protein